MAEVIAIANQKGGVGKTTTAVNISSCLAVAEKKTLLIDIDPQANATSGFGFSKEDIDVSVYEVLVNNTRPDDAIVETPVPNLSLMPSNIKLVGAEIELVNVVGRERVLDSVLNGIRDSFDYVIVDCPPSLGLLTLNTLTAADSVLIPIQCEYYALEGLGQLLNTIRLVQKHLNSALKVAGVVLTMYDSRLNLSRQVADEARRFFADKVFRTVINRNVRLSEAPSFGKPIIMYDIMSTGARNYIELAREIMQR
jgi:chromosome partitioning protein